MRAFFAKRRFKKMLERARLSLAERARLEAQEKEEQSQRRAEEAKVKRYKAEQDGSLNEAKGADLAKRGMENQTCNKSHYLQKTTQSSLCFDNCAMNVSMHVDMPIFCFVVGGRGTAQDQGA